MVCLFSKWWNSKPLAPVATEQRRCWNQPAPVSGNRAMAELSKHPEVKTCQDINPTPTGITSSDRSSRFQGNFARPGNEIHSVQAHPKAPTDKVFQCFSHLYNEIILFDPGHRVVSKPGGCFFRVARNVCLQWAADSLQCEHKAARAAPAPCVIITNQFLRWMETWQSAAENEWHNQKRLY